ncbi:MULTISPECIES: rhomboid family intramembrane serine protease [unclassified Corynebacterium]
MTFEQHLRSYYRTAPVTAWIVAANCALWLATAVQSRSVTDSYYHSTLAMSWSLWGPEFAAGHYWQAVTSAFMHLGLGHLAVNMFLLVLIGREIETYLGSARYALVYLAAVLGASASIVWMAFTQPTAGASGALFALMVVLVAVNYQRRTDLRAPIVLVVVNIAYTFLATGVSLWGHLGGVAVGVVLALCVAARNPKVSGWGVAATTAAAFLLLVARAGLWG